MLYANASVSVPLKLIHRRSSLFSDKPRYLPNDIVTAASHNGLEDHANQASAATTRKPVLAEGDTGRIFSFVLQVNTEEDADADVGYTLGSSGKRWTKLAALRRSF